jgi:hypothetical protein
MRRSAISICTTRFTAWAGPGTAHYVPPGFGLLDRTEWLLEMIAQFLDAQMPEGS